MKIFASLHEFEQAVGTHLGHGEWLEITQERINQFAEATGDHQWIHVDPARAATGPFGATIAHGFLTLSLIPLLTDGILHVDGLAMSVNYGCNKVRFLSPVLVGSRLRADVELISVEHSATGALVVTRVTVNIDSADKPACVSEAVSLMVA